MVENGRKVWIPDDIVKKRGMQASVHPKLSAPGVVYGTAIDYGSRSAAVPAIHGKHCRTAISTISRWNCWLSAISLHAYLVNG